MKHLKDLFERNQLVHPNYGKFLDKLEPFLRMFGIYKYTYIRVENHVFRLYSYSYADKHFAGRVQIRIRDRMRLNKTTYCGYTVGAASCLVQYVKPSEVKKREFKESIEI